MTCGWDTYTQSLYLTHLGRYQCDQFCRNCTTLANIEKKWAKYLMFIWFWEKFSTHFGTICTYVIGHIFIDKYGLLLKTQFGHLVTLR